MAPHNPITLNCALTRFLVEASCQDQGAESAFAGAMLADLGYFDLHPSEPNFGNVLNLLGILKSGKHAITLDKLSAQCGKCHLLPECTVGSGVHSAVRNRQP